MKIRFLLVTVDKLAGTERAAVAQANALAARHDVEIVSILRTTNARREDVDRRVRVRYLTSIGGDVGTWGVDHEIARAAELAKLPSTLVPHSWDPTLNALCDAALEEYLARPDADVVVTLTPGVLVAAVQRLPRSVAVVHQEHRSSMHREGGLEPLLAFAPRADAVVSLTEVNAEWLREQLGTQAPAVHVVPNAAPGPEQPQSSLDRPLIVAAGRLDAEKQHIQLVRAFGSIADQIPEWRLRIFGTGPMRIPIIRAARRHGLYDRVELPGATTDLAAEWATASISALTSQKEGLPLVIQESFAAGVPVISYDCPTGPSELIEHGVNGFLVPQGDEEALAGHLLELARDRELRQRLGDAARHSLSRFDLNNITAQWEQIYADAVDGRRRGAPWVTRQLDAERARTAVAVAAPAITPTESRRQLVGTIADSLVDIPGWFVLPARAGRPPTFVVPGEHRQEWLRVIEESHLPGHLSISVEYGDHWLVRRGPVADMARRLRSALVKGLAVEPWAEQDGVRSHLANGAGVRVEFWTRDREGFLTTSQQNPFARRVAADDVTPDCAVEGVKVPGLAGMQGPFADEVGFPIDVVYTWVDDRDPVWRRNRDEWLAVSDPQQLRREAAGDARFRNRDELRYSLRSLHAHAPWVRTIHVVTAGQRPEWLSDHPKVRLVDHQEILPSDALPTFNSHAIESALHRIPGLAEHFIYFNDDMFLARPLAPESFFTPTGSFAAFLSNAPVGLDDRDDRPFIKAAVNGRHLIQDRFGVNLTQTFSHLPYPLSKRVMEEMYADFRDALDRTAHSKFRSPTDVSPTSSLAQYYGLLTGNAHRGDLDLNYVDTSRGNLRPRLIGLLRREHDAFCVGDQHDYALPEPKVNQFLAEFFEAYFPVRPPWELEH